MTAKLDLMIGVIGLGYVGVPLAMRLSRVFEVIGYDIDDGRVNELQKGVDRTFEFNELEILQSDIKFTSQAGLLENCNVYIVTVPTPVDENNTPDLGALISASKCIGKLLQKGDMVIYESTVYPGATQEVCVPVLEQTSLLKFDSDFSVAYSPERVSPGSGGKRIEEISKIISASSDEALNIVEHIYKVVTDEELHRASSIEVAEFAKVLENTQRDLNIALINEVSHICARMGIRTRDVIKAAGTKWNFSKYYPGLVGGHCVGVDPYYLLHKSAKVGYLAEVITTGRRVNEKMSHLISRRTMKAMSKLNKPFSDMKVAIYGMTFKEDCPDGRNSKVIDLVSQFNEFGIKVHCFDPFAGSISGISGNILKIQKKPQDGELFDAIIVAVGHKEYVEMGGEAFVDLLFSKNPQLIFDVKSCLGEGNYMSL